MELKTELENAIKEQKEIMVGVKTNGYESLNYLIINELEYTDNNIYIKEENDSEINICILNGINYDVLDGVWEIPVDNGEVFISIID